MLKKNKKQKRVSAVRKNILPRKSFSHTYLVKVVFLLAIVGVGFGGANLYTSLQLFPVQKVRVEGEFNYLDKALIKQKIAAHTVGGFFDLDIVSIRSELINMQWVDDAFVRREWPESVIIRVVEKKPVAKWNNEGVLTASGDLFFPKKSYGDLKIVELKGPNNRHKYVLSEFNKVQSLLHQAEMKVIKLSQNDRRSWEMNVEGVAVYLGRKNIYKKIENLASVYAALIKPKVDKIQSIDFRYTNGFAVTWKKKVAKIMDNEKMYLMSMIQLNTKQSFLMGAIKYV